MNEYSKNVMGGTFIKEWEVSDKPRGGAKGLGRTLQWVTKPPRNGKLVTNREEVLKVWEGHYSELLNHQGMGS